jgi:hypothetical protein
MRVSASRAVRMLSSVVRPTQYANTEPAPSTAASKTINRRNEKRLRIKSGVSSCVVFIASAPNPLKLHGTGAQLRFRDLYSSSYPIAALTVYASLRRRF